MAVEAIWERNFHVSYIIDRCQELEFYIERVVWHVCLPVYRSQG